MTILKSVISLESFFIFNPLLKFILFSLTLDALKSG
jgi:hypothetical protein